VSSPPTTRRGFIFDWQPIRWNTRLFLLILLSILLHFVAFYLFQIIYPATKTLPPATAQIEVLDWHRPEDRGVLEWTEVHDPSKLTLPRSDTSIVTKLIPDYRPLWNDLNPRRRTPDLETDPVPDQTEPSLLTPRLLFVNRTPPPASANHTTFRSSWVLGPNLKRRAPTALSPLPTTDRLLEPCQFFVRINPAGNVTQLFLLHSSGDVSTDEKAATWLREARFAPAVEDSWDTVRINWGG
jgi:hypothetical protein